MPVVQTETIDAIRILRLDHGKPNAISTEVAAGAGRWRDPHDNLWTFQLQHKF